MPGPSDALRPLGRYVLMLADAFRRPGEFRRYRPEFTQQLTWLGVDSFPVVMLGGVFIGSVSALQAIYQIRLPLIPESTVGAAVVPPLVIETAVLVTAFILAGRIGARVAAEIGSMRATDQIDALEVMGVSAPAYLVAPRVVAGTLMFPLLYVAACFVGSLSGWGAAVFSHASLTSAEFWDGVARQFRTFDFVYGSLKSVVFGFVITSVSCYQGFFGVDSAQAVGEAATSAAVLSAVYVLLADAVMAWVLL